MAKFGKGSGAPRGNKNAAGRHKSTGVKRAPIPDGRTGIQKFSQGLLGIKRDEATGRMYVGSSLAAGIAKDKATAKRYNSYKAQGMIMPEKLVREMVFAAKKR